MNCGYRCEGGREGREQGVGSRSSTRDPSVDGHSHHDHQKGDLPVSKKGWLVVQRRGSGHKGEQGGNWLKGLSSEK